MPGAVAAPPEPAAARAVEVYLDHLAVERGLAANTLLSYRRDLSRWLGWLAANGRQRLSEVTEADVAGFLAALRTGDEEHPPLSSSSAGRAVVAVRGLHRFALREGWTTADPAREVRPPVPARRLPKAISVRSVEDYLVRARPGLVAAGRGTPALLLNARGGRLSRQSAWTVLRSAASRAGIAGDVSPHTLRHCFATHLLDGGADVRVVQELLGHASVTTTQVYTLVTVDRLREVYATSHPRARS